MQGLLEEKGTCVGRKGRGERREVRNYNLWHFPPAKTLTPRFAGGGERTVSERNEGQKNESEPFLEAFRQTCHPGRNEQFLSFSLSPFCCLCFSVTLCLFRWKESSLLQHCCNIIEHVPNLLVAGRVRLRAPSPAYAANTNIH